MKAVLITGRTLAQGQSKEHGKTLAKYMEACAICEMDDSDMATIGVKQGDNVKLTTEFGSVVVKAVKAKSPTKDIVFVPYGPWANMLTGPETQGTGMPHFKGLEVEVKHAPTEKVLGLEELIRTSYGREK